MYYCFTVVKIIVAIYGISIKTGYHGNVFVFAVFNTVGYH